ncbi:MAG: decaprenyl-phosphate phosphoribosyltransferase [Actinobacteria bacterium]|nr:decaprenyl-phosphate phosphoribosyltransferase [Actinomycetota bacterium]
MTTSHPSRSTLLGGIVRELRPKQWIKNVLVFAAPLAAGVFNNRDTDLHALGAFGCFCAAASATYLLNDAIDIESDRLHPVKKNRPMAAGIVPVGLAYALGTVLLIIAIGGSFLLRRDFGFTILAYLALTTVYTLWLKHVPILDIVAVAAGFVLRAIGGATATGLPISEWFFIVTSFGALFMVTGKRAGERSELGEDAAAIRPALAAYTPQFLNYLKAVFSAGTLITYCLWAFASAQESTNGSVLFQLSIVPFAVAILRYALLLEQGKGAEPENLVLSDRTLLLAGALWAIVYSCAVYAS